MRSSVIASLCAAPLVLAGSIQHDLAGRGMVSPELAERSAVLVERETVIVQAKNEDVIIIWTNNGGGAATQTVTETKTVTAAGGVAAAAATHTVVVGGTSGGAPNLVYTPDSVLANVGDMVVFEFMAQNHTVTQSAFTTPCDPLAGGMDSGFIANPNGTVNPPPAMAMQVMTDAPTWFYCRQKGHCGKGMAFSINPTTNKTQQMFKSMAIAQNGTGTASPITGGTSSAGAGTSSAAAAPPAAAPPAAPSAAAPPASVASGTGTIGTDGACSCSCLCGQAAFPVAAQGIGMFGGMSGAMPAALLEK
ncbi:Cupredoxin protein [Rutstroemia sp. NJR-2017a BBW]|nr:Cupredoxin protein [Rutstroemia sp. NJR-2017a BBW]